LSLLVLMTFPVYANLRYNVLGVYLTSLSNFFLNFFSLARTTPWSRAPLPGDYMPGVPPVPIPNTAVKPRAANGSWTLGPARVGRCQVYGPVLLIEVSGLFRFYPPHASPLTRLPLSFLPATSLCGIDRNHYDLSMVTITTSLWSPLRTKRYQAGRC